MNILNITWKEIKVSFRDYHTFILMLAFPIILMLILGSALSNNFDKKIKVDNVHVIYKNSASQAVFSYFQSFIKEAKVAGIDFTEVADGINGRDEVKENHFTAFIEVTDKGLTLIGSSQNSIEESILQGMLTAFADKYNLAAAVVSVDPTKVSTVLASSTKHDYITEHSLRSAKAPSSMDYYAIAITTMIAFYAALYGMGLLREERVKHTSIRLLAAPIRKSEIFLGKIIGCVLVNLICVAAIVIFSHYVYKAEWGSHIGLVFLILISEIFLAVSFGLGISYMVKSHEAARTITTLVIQLVSFFGGAYFKIDHPTGIFKFITDLSPLTWVNQAITKIIYNNDLAAVVQPVALNMGVSLLFLMIAIISFQRREGL
ncbi:ABC transporter permease [Neobacillus thermocopriae]|uniref:ABC transporter permease n=1 Tax=Neobacillus thermocopriae TaxID=1215031 RepID=A0A6B3TV09_9BACI|nr:ABC transporter permease [Neobacillus thermocopriae]NEX79477.1 ABC transporter permease [Neobacillus thermocopriae]